MRFSPAFAASIGAIAALAIGVSAFAALEPRENTTRLRGPALQIALVAPKEPAPGAGTIMDVGSLEDGYEHRPFVRAEYTPMDNWVEDDGADVPPPSRRPWAPAVEEVQARAVEIIDDVRERPLSFGFDRVRDEYAEERRQRRDAFARLEMEQREAERREMDRRDASLRDMNARHAQRREMQRGYRELAYDDRRPPPVEWRRVEPPRPAPSHEETFY